MSPSNLHCFLSVMTIIFAGFLFDFPIESTLVYPLGCASNIPSCNSYLYHISKGLSIEEMANFYSVNTSQIQSITHDAKLDYLVSVPCTCKDVNGTLGYFYDTLYKVKPGDTYAGVSGEFYSGQAWMIAAEEQLLVAGDMITIHLVCGCLGVENQEAATYTVQDRDTLLQIAELLSANLSEIENLNRNLIRNPNFIDIGWVLFVPIGKRKIQAPKAGKRHNLPIIIGTILVVTLLSMSMLVRFLIRRNRNHRKNRDLEAVNKSPSAKKSSSQNQLLQDKYMEGVASIESERPVTYSLEEINEATNNFDESRKIGQGGYGTVYIGLLKEQEVAIKKMKFSQSKEFFAELKVLCKIHHINVVELLGYARGDNHLYLIYEYIQNGSLNDHLHDPVLKGHLPLSWTARANVALDAARGIEYIHDHTKTRYVHRDIKTSNILLDQRLEAKVADFGLARLVERSNEEDVVATCLVGTPGYIAPECARELQMTSKTDVFAFGVVLAELVTGQRALIRNNQEPNKMKSLVSVIYTIFQVTDKEGALEANIDANLRGSYPMEEVYKMAELSRQCLNEDAMNQPAMREVVQKLSQILTSSIEWEAALRGNNCVFSRMLKGR
ncbi:Kinase family protein / peptidoglycan-binding LysM domain-containing protein, putative [Theobroma cacao]|uniref:Kinase family protein / peptidoglycan-binding LysM domain-containing protein, putative n=1 Tax=Theobroma cacao TaxID=3641 RepID=A0A061FUU9_THECC|nr:Kinase family protein / peptidoglycan-binding LysM domain-containing protein, putative [Theobroma cacao]